MGVDYDAVAGIGINFDYITLNKFGLLQLWEEFEDAVDQFDVLETLLKEVKNIVYGESGNAHSGETQFHLFAKDPIFGVDTF